MAGRIPDHIIEEIRKSNDIVDIVGDYVQLKKQSRNYFGLCPFHNENTPSFSVSPDKQIFHCFGCGKGGNVFTFMREIEGMSFQEAVGTLAEKSGHHISDHLSQSDEDVGRDTETQKILEAHEWLTKLFHHLLRHTKEGKEGYDYLIQRGFTDDVIDTFQLGFAPNTKDFTKKFLEKKGFHPQSMVKAGLLSYNNSSEYVDRFRGRVIFPIRNHQGKTVAFGGRTTNGSEPKYLNSPETELFHKGNLLYNFDLARTSVRNKAEIVLFEGYMDVIAANQSGVHHGVATLGTSITETQAKLIRRYVDRVIICYDSDQAGIEASFKAANLLRSVGCYVRIAELPDGMDPDDYIQRFGSEKFQQQVTEQSSTYMSFVMKYLKKDFNLNHEGDRIQYIEKVLDEISKVEKPIERDYYLRDIVQEFDMSLETLKNEVDDRRKKRSPQLQRDNQAPKSHTNNIKYNHQTKKLLPAFHNAERHLIALMLRDVSIANKVQEQIGGAFNINEHQVIVTYLYAYYEEGQEPNISSFLEHLSDEALKNLVSEIAMIPIQEDVTDQEIKDYIRIIQAKKSEKESILLLRAEQKEAERQNDHVKAAQIAMRILELKKQLKYSMD